MLILAAIVIITLAVILYYTKQPAGTTDSYDPDARALALAAGAQLQGVDLAAPPPNIAVTESTIRAPGQQWPTALCPGKLVLLTGACMGKKQDYVNGGGGLCGDGKKWASTCSYLE